VGIPEATQIQLHTMVDASEKAYAAVCYWSIQHPDGIEVKFVASKNKVAPKKQLSIPRLELQAAVLGARLAETLLQEHRLKVDKKFFWSDSQTVLSWIASDHRKYRQFVANRVSEILDSTSILDWHWVPSKSNVADEATKRQKQLDMSINSRWFQGPAFLKLDPSEWPKMTSPKSEISCKEELRPIKVYLNKEQSTKYNFIQPSRFSSWRRMLRTVGWIVRIRNLIKEGTPKKRSLKTIPKVTDVIQNVRQLTAQEIEDAENYILKKLQWEAFPNEIRKLENGQKCNGDSKLSKLSPYLECNDGLIHLKGRIDATPHIVDEFKRPIILSRNHQITALLIQEYHERFHHVNSETVKRDQAKVLDI
jgi:hypothetical protein